MSKSRHNAITTAEQKYGLPLPHPSWLYGKKVAERGKTPVTPGEFWAKLNL